MSKRRSAAVVMGVALAITTLLAPGIAAAGPAPVTEGRHCATLLGKGKPGEASPVIARHCSDDQDVAIAAISRVSAAETYLGSVWEHEYLKGQSELFFGDYGPCDSEGYRVDNIRWGMQNMTSSALGWSNCNYITLYDFTYCNPDGGYWGEAEGSDSIVIDALPAFNDRASSIRFRHL